MTMCCARSIFLRTHSSSSEAAVTCDPNGRPLTTGLQAVSGFPANQAFLPDVIRRRRSRQIQPQYRIEEELLSIDKILYIRLIISVSVNYQPNYLCDNTIEL